MCKQRNKTIGLTNALFFGWTFLWSLLVLSRKGPERGEFDNEGISASSSPQAGGS